MPTELPQLPNDPTIMETTLVNKIKEVFESVPEVAQFAQVHTRERFSDNEDDDKLVSTIDDPDSGLSITSIIEIGVPTIAEKPYAGNDGCTQLDFTYPITYSLAVVDAWAKSSLIYKNSTDLAKAIYLKARQRFKRNEDGTLNRQLGYLNCVHNYLQQDSAVTVEDEETGGREHLLEWSLTIQVTGVTQ